MGTSASHLLDDVIQPGLRIVFCGTALGAESARRRAYYAGRGNKFWPTLYTVGLTSRQLEPGEYFELLSFGLGLTDLCKTRSGVDKAIGLDGFDVDALVSTLMLNKPTCLAFNGKAAAKAALGVETVAYGAQDRTLGGTPVYVLPSTSGAAKKHWDIGPWEDLAERAGDL